MINVQHLKLLPFNGITESVNSHGDTKNDFIGKMTLMYSKLNSYCFHINDYLHITVNLLSVQCNI